MKKNVLIRISLVFSLVLMFSMTLFAKNNSKLLINGKDFGYNILIKNGVSYMKTDDFLDMFVSEPPVKTSKSITYIKRSIPSQEYFLEIEYKDNSISWNGKKTGAYAIKSNGELYIPIRSVCKYLDYKTVWDAATGNVNLLTYHTETLKNKTVNVMGFSLPARLFDKFGITLEENKLPYISYSISEDRQTESLSAHVDVLEAEKLLNLLTLMFNVDFAKQIVESMNDSGEHIEISLGDGLVLSHYVSSDGLYSISIIKELP